MDVVGTIVGGYRIDDALQQHVYLGHGPEGARAIITVVSPPPSSLLAELALPFEGITPLRGTVPVGDRLAVIENEPIGWTIAELKWPLPMNEVITAGLDLARLLANMHAAGAVHGALLPHLTWIDAHSRLTGTTPRPERLLAPHEPHSVHSDVLQLCKLLDRLATRSSGELPWPVGDARTRTIEQLARAARISGVLGPLHDALERYAR